ncbi:Lamb1 [Symbiodinium pilosum]|uniref:Lamb1 protein n=1 Tax=Symbiodinium pilosum TaxID=2952 RepID=A0A812P0V2_SYMPI|nr:Lamb1 [Symbiodinium pilosum]
MWRLSLLAVAACGSAQPNNEVGLSLAKAGAGLDATAQAQAAVAQMTGQLLLKQQQYAAAKLKMEQLARQEESYSRRTDLMAKRESRMEEKRQAHGGVLDQAFKAKARTQAAQNKMIKGEAEVKKLNQEIKAEKQLIKTSEEQLKEIRLREDEYNNGARLAVMKSNKLERDLKEARIELAAQKEKFAEMTEAASVEEAKWDSARRVRENQEAENAAKAQLLESKQGQLGLLRQINPQDMAVAEKQLEQTKLLLKEAKHKNKADAVAEEKALQQQQAAADASHRAAEAKLHKVQLELEHAKEEQRAALRDARARVQHHATSDEQIRMQQAEKALKPYQKKLEDAEARLHHQEIDNQALAQDLNHQTAALQEEARQNVSGMKLEETRGQKELEYLRKTVAEGLKEDKNKQSNMQRTMTRMKASKSQQTRKVQEIDTKLRAEQAKLEEASLRLQTFQRKETQEQLDYEKKMYEVNALKEAKAQQEVDRLQQEFHKVHADKSERITQLNHKLHELKQGKLRGV